MPKQGDDSFPSAPFFLGIPMSDVANSGSHPALDRQLRHTPNNPCHLMKQQKQQTLFQDDENRRILEIWKHPLSGQLLP